MGDRTPATTAQGGVGDREADRISSRQQPRRDRSVRRAPGRQTPGKPGPVLIIQDDRFDATASITVCPLTTDPTDIPLLWIALDPTDTNGLAEPSRIMLDKVTTMPRSKLGDRIGCVSDTDMVTLSRGVVVFLGLA
jgi:mRNA interferase MazF